MLEAASQLNHYTSPFILDAAKLTRILTVIEDRFKSAGINFDPSFQVTLEDGKRVKVGTLDALLNLDNTIKNPVTSIEISDNSDSDKLEASITFDGAREGNIAIVIRGSEPKIVGELFAEVEEQVERTRVGGWPQKLLGSSSALLIPFIGTLTVVSMSIALIAFGGSYRDTTTGLTKEAAKQLARELSKVVTTEDKINWLFDVHRRQLELGGSESTINIGKFATWPNFFLALPVVIVLMCLIYMARTCYPRAVFCWGDWEDHYKGLVSKRRTVWGVIIAAMAIGVISSLFVVSFQRFIPTK